MTETMPMSDGDLIVKIGADISALHGAEREAKAVGQQIERALNRQIDTKNWTVVKEEIGRLKALAGQLREELVRATPGSTQAAAYGEALRRVEQYTRTLAAATADLKRHEEDVARARQNTARVVEDSARREERAMQQRGRALLAEQQRTLREGQQAKREEEKTAKDAARDMRQTIAADEKRARREEASGLQDANRSGYAFGSSGAVNLHDQRAIAVQQRVLGARALELHGELLRLPQGGAEYKRLQAELHGVEEQLTRLQKAAQQARQQLHDLRGMSGLNRNMSLMQQTYSDRYGVVGPALNQAGNYMLMGGGAMIAAGYYFVNAAKNAVEATQMFEVTFAKNAADTRAWSEATAKEYARNSYAVREYAAQFATVLKPGVGLDRATEMAKELTRRAYDIQSFRNHLPGGAESMTMDEANAEIHSAMAGEQRAARRIGADVSMPTLTKVAQSHGLKEFSEETDEATKRVVRFWAIMQQTADAEGDVIRTMSSPANKQRAINEQWEQTRIEIGYKLLPVFDKLLTQGQHLVNWLSSLTDTQKQNLVTGMEWVAAILIVGGGLLKLTNFALGAQAALATLAIAKREAARAAKEHAEAEALEAEATAATGNVAKGTAAKQGAGGIMGLFGKVGITNPYIAAAAAAGALAIGANAIYNATDKSQTSESAANARIQLLDAEMNHRRALAEELERLGKRYDELKAKTSRSATEDLELSETKNQLASRIKDVRKELNLQQEAWDGNTSSIRNMLDALRDMSDKEKELAAAKAHLDVVNAQQKLIDAQGAAGDWWGETKLWFIDHGMFMSRGEKEGLSNYTKYTNYQAAKGRGSIAPDDFARIQAAYAEVEVAQQREKDLNAALKDKGKGVTPPDQIEHVSRRHMAPDLSSYDVGAIFSDYERQRLRQQSALEHHRRMGRYVNPFDREAVVTFASDSRLKETEMRNTEEMGARKAELLQQRTDAERAAQQRLTDAELKLEQARLANDKDRIAKAQTLVNLRQDEYATITKEWQTREADELAMLQSVHDRRLQDIRDETDERLASIRREKELYDQFRNSAQAFAGLWLFKNQQFSAGLNAAFQSPYMTYEALKQGQGLVVNNPAAMAGFPALPKGARVPTADSLGVRPSRVVLEIDADGVRIKDVVGEAVDATMTTRGQTLQSGRR